MKGKSLFLLCILISFQALAQETEQVSAAENAGKVVGTIAFWAAVIYLIYWAFTKGGKTRSK